MYKMILKLKKLTNIVLKNNTKNGKRGSKTRFTWSGFGIGTFIFTVKVSCITPVDGIILWLWSKALVVKRLLSKMLVFLIIDFKILGHFKKKFFQEKTVFKGIIFWHFQTATCYNSSLVLSRVDPALVKAAYNVACPQPNGNTLITLCCANDVRQSVDPFTTALSGYLGQAC